MTLENTCGNLAVEACILPISIAVKSVGDSVWINLALKIGPQDRPGSMSDNDPKLGRRVLLFGYVEGKPVVLLSDFGMDMATQGLRVVRNLAGWTTLATLEPGKPFKTIVTPGGQQTKQVRFIYTAD